MQDVQDTRRQVRLSSIRVSWSESDAAFVAHSEQFPGLSCVDQFSSLAAVAGLLDAIERDHASAPNVPGGGRSRPALLFQ